MQFIFQQFQEQAKFSNHYSSLPSASEKSETLAGDLSEFLFTFFGGEVRLTLLMSWLGLSLFFNCLVGLQLELSENKLSFKLKIINNSLN